MKMELQIIQEVFFLRNQLEQDKKILTIQA